LAASKKWEKEREKEAKKIKKKEEKDRRRRSKSEKKKKKKDKATATTDATTGDQPPFALQPPATLQADGTALPPSAMSRPVVAWHTLVCSPIARFSWRPLAQGGAVRPARTGTPRTL
jgi:outer membrane biosynthesis protein TonB